MSERKPVAEAELLAWRHGALPARERETLAARIKTDPAATATLAEWDRQDASLTALYGPISAEPLPEVMRAQLQAASGKTNRSVAARWPALARLAAAIALVAIGAAGGWGAAQLRPAATAAPGAALAAIRAHQTFALEVAHPVEVAASDAEHLTRWLSNRLGHSIQAPDFATFGFALLGGRILPAETGTAAVFLYENDSGQRITLYASPGDGTDDAAFRFVEAGATQGFWWVDSGLRYALVGEVAREALRAIATAAWDQLI